MPTFPQIQDEFSYLLASDTYSSFRLTNPSHVLWRFFETIHVLEEPTYQSKYPARSGDGPGGGSDPLRLGARRGLAELRGSLYRCRLDAPGVAADPLGGARRTGGGLQCRQPALLGRDVHGRLGGDARWRPPVRRPDPGDTRSPSPLRNPHGQRTPAPCPEPPLRRSGGSIARRAGLPGLAGEAAGVPPAPRLAGRGRAPDPDPGPRRRLGALLQLPG